MFSYEITVGFLFPNPQYKTSKYVIILNNLTTYKISSNYKRKETGENMFIFIFVP